MANTYCKGCIFSSPTETLAFDYSGDSHCKFNIPQYIKEIKTISVKEKFYYIENYMCRYAFADSIMKQNSDLDAETIENLIIEKAKLKYYMAVNIIGASCSSLILDMILSINNLDIKPIMLSIISDASLDKANVFNTIQQNLDKNIKWKMHNFVNTIPLNDRFNIASETTLENIECSNIFLYDAATKENTVSLNNMINHVHYIRNVEQKRIYGFIEKDNSLSGLCLPVLLYKSLITNVDRDIIKAINTVQEIKLERYEIEKST